MDEKKKIKICFAASSGGHYEQLMMLKPLMKKYDSFVITEKTDYSAESKGEKTYYMKQVNRREKDFIWRMGKADIVITHGGTGAIIGAVKKGKKVIAVPRRAKYGEHVDDHQLQLIKQFDDLNLICPCRDTDELAEAIETVKHTRYAAYESNTTTIVDSIEKYIKELV